MFERRYYMLVSSLPALPTIKEAERLPINETRLAERLRMLHPDDAEVIGSMRTFLKWEDQTPGQTDEEVTSRYHQLLAKIPQGSVRRIVHLRTDLRTVLAALRRRHHGEDEPPAGRDWGTGRWRDRISANWNHPDFKLAGVFPWIPEAREHLENGEALELEELVAGLSWDALDRLAAGKYFELEAVIAFVFKWEVLRRWLTYRGEAAARRIEKLASDILENWNPPAAAPAATP